MPQTDTEVLAERERQAAAKERAARVKLADMDEQEVAKMELYAEAIGNKVAECIEAAFERLAKKNSSNGKDKDRERRNIFGY